MTGWFWLVPLLGTFLLLGFAYLVWVFADKESGGLKLTGQIIAVVIAILAVILFLGGLYLGVTGRGMYGGPRMMGIGQPGMHRSVEKMMQDPQMRKWMEEYLKKVKK